jgi:hypothetical protein
MFFVITHTDAAGETHQLRGAWEAESAAEAISAMLAEAGAVDDGRYTAHRVITDDDVI